MSTVNVVQQNFAAGELSPRMRGRFDLPIYYNGCERMLNFIAETQGNGKFRTGTKYVVNTRRNNVACLIPFQFNDQQSYVIELTAGYMRFYRDGDVILGATKTITGITQASPGVVTSASHGYTGGEEIFIDGVVGMTELNGRNFLVTYINANTFSLTDQDGNAINTMALTAYASGGSAAAIVELQTPYVEADLFDLRYGQNADTMYIVHNNYEPRKLTRSSHTSWTLALFTRTNDPFLSKKTITAVTAANPGNVTAVAHGYATGDEIIIETIVGMTQLNGRNYSVVVTGVDNFTLLYNGVAVDTSAYTAYSSAGYASNRKLLPSAFAFYEGRSCYGSSDLYPERFWLSRSPDTNGASRYDDFTTGSDADHACIFTLSPSNGKVDKIEWFAGTNSFLAIGTFGGISKADGGNADDSITPSNINVRPMDSLGVADMVPVRLGTSIIYVQRGSRRVFSFEFDYLADSYVSTDRNLVADHMTLTGLTQVTFQNGQPDIFWATRNDGLLVGVTYKSREDVSGWHRHKIGGTAAMVTSVCSLPTVNNFDQLWMVNQRTINSHTRRYVEYFADEPTIPEFIDYFTDPENKTEDDAKWRRAMFEAQKEYIHVDSAVTYDGTTPGSDAGAAITPAAVSGNSVTFTSNASVFKSTDVGRQIWKKAIDGDGYGRAIITGYTSATQVTCRITVDFDSVTAMTAGYWYLTTDSITILGHLEAESVTVVTDGAVHPNKTVASRTIALDYQASVVHIGLGYSGFAKSMNLEAGGQIGPSQTKPKNINRVGIKFLNTLGARYGTSLYKMFDVSFRSTADTMDRPAPLFSGDKVLPYEDSTSTEKHVYIQQTKPLPCIVQLLTPYVDTDNS